MRFGTAIFTMPAGPIKCAGAPHKIAYLAADYWRQQGVLEKIRVVLVLPTPGRFGGKVFADELERVAAKYGIEVHNSSEVTDIDPDGQHATVRDNTDLSTHQIHYDFLHVVPPQSAPDWLAGTDPADPNNPAGYVEIDKNIMQHNRFSNIFTLGNARSSPNSKTGAAIRETSAGGRVQPPAGRRRGRAARELRRLLLLPADHRRQQDAARRIRLHHAAAPLVPVHRRIHERTDTWYFKRYGLPAMYWNLMLKRRA